MFLELFYGLRAEGLPLGMQEWLTFMEALKKGLAVREVPVSYRRRVGVSKITGTVTGTLRAGYKILWMVARYAWSRE